jgi:hypothetical protein
MLLLQAIEIYRKRVRTISALLLSSLILLSSVSSCLASALTVTLKNPPNKLARLRDYDLVVVIDKSRSMSVADCRNLLTDVTAKPSEIFGLKDPKISRWEWCREQTLKLTEATQDVLNEGFKLVVFSKDAVEYSNVGPKAIEAVFRDNKPEGPTHATATLNTQFEEYFAKRSNIGADAKPLLILMITDGCPQDPPSLCASVLNAARRMNRPDEITLTIVQIGHDQKAAHLLSRLNDPTDGAKYRIVNTKSFDEVEKIGLTGTLLSAITPKESDQPYFPTH